MYRRRSPATGSWGLVRACKAHACAGVLFLVVVPALMAEEIARLTPEENFVLQELKGGHDADLSHFPAKDRILGHEFMMKLLTGGYRDPVIERHGVSIINAVFADNLEVSSAAVPFRVWLTACEFQRGVDFSYTTFARDLSLGGSHFGTPRAQPQAVDDTDDVQAYFAGMKVNGTTDLSNTVFYVPVDFTYAELSTDLVFDHVDYWPSKVADFDEMRVKGPVFFRKDHFAGKLNLADAELFELYLEGPDPKDDSTPEIVELDLTQARIERGAFLKNVRLKSWTAGFLVANGAVKLDNVIPIGPVDLVHSYFRSLTITGFDEWLKLKPGTLKLEGISFDSLDIGETSIVPPAARMLELINSDSCPFSPQPYLELERFLRAHGNVQKADEVYIDMRRRQRQQLSWINRPWDFVLDKMLGYGKETWRAVLCAVILTIAGVFFFSPDRMEWKNPEKKQTTYNRLLYSLDQLAPVIDLDAAKNWGAKEDQRWTRNYAVFHRIAGWILLPLVVGAITGIVK